MSAPHPHTPRIVTPDPAPTPTPAAADDRFRRFLDLCPDGVFTVDAGGCFREVNAAFCRIVERTAGELTGLHFGEILPPEDRARVEGLFRARAAGDRSAHSFECNLWTPAGERRAGQVRTVALVEEGRLVGVQGWARDVTEQRLADELLRGSEARFQTVFESAGVAIGIGDLQGRLVAVNPAAERLFGYGAGEMRGLSSEDLTHSDDREKEGPLLRDLISGEREQYRMEKRYLRRDGRVIWGRLVASLVRGSAGEPQFALRMVEDVSERKEAELRVQERDERIALLFAQMPAVVWTTDRELRFTSSQGSFAPGVEEGIVGQELHELMAALGPESPAIAAHERALAGEEAEYEMEWSGRVYEARVRPLRGEDGIVGVIGVATDVTERRQAQHALDLQERRLHALVERAPDSISVLGVDGTIRYLSPALGRILGRAPGEISGRPAFDYVHPDDLGRVAAVWSRLLATPGATLSVEYRVVQPDGGEVMVESVASNWASDPAVEGIIVNTRDVTAQKSAEGALRAQARQQSALAELGQRAVVESDLDALLDLAAEQLQQVLDVDCTKVLQLDRERDVFVLRAGRGWGEAPPEQASFPASEQSQARFTVESELPVVVEELASETRFSGPDLLIASGVVSGMSVVIGGRERPFGVLGVHTRRRRRFSADEIAYLQTVANVLAQAVEQREAERALRETKEQLEAFLDMLPDEAWLKDEAGRYRRVNRAFASERGLPREAILGRSDREIFPARQAKRFRAEDEQVMRTGGLLRTEDRGSDADGTVRVWEVAKAPFVDSRGRVRGVVGLSRDITEREAARQRILFQAEVLDAVGHAVVATDLGGRILYWSPAAESLFGWTAGEARGLRAGELIVPAGERAAARAITARVRAGESWTGEFQVVAKDGRAFPALITDAPICGADGRVMGMVGTLSDLSGQKRLEEQLRQAQKMEAVGRLAGGIAHDFNNLLTVIQGSVDLSIELEAAEAAARRTWRRSTHALERATALTRPAAGLQPPPGAPARGRGRQRALVRAQTAASAGSWARTSHLEARLAPELARVRVDPGQFEQVLLNLAVNARDAMPRGGRLTIGTANAG